MAVVRSFKRLLTLVLFAAGVLVFGFVAPSVTGLLLLAALLVVPLVLVGGIGWLVWRSAFGRAALPEAAVATVEPDEGEEQMA